MAANGNTRKLVKVPAAIVVVPNAAADLTTKDTWIYQLVVTNVTASAATLLVKDKQGTPKVLIGNPESIPANSTKVYTYPEGVYMQGGVNWVAGTASALQASVTAFRVAG